MNKQRIQELALQAGAKLGPYVHEVDLLQPDGTYKWDEERHTDTTTIDLEKFAELIVRECFEHCKGQLVDKKTAEHMGLTYNDAVGDCANGLLQHFGVEE